MNEIDNIQDYEELIGELKMLYTVVTRARCTLILHDNNIPEDFLYIWNSHFLVESDIYNPQIQERIRDEIEHFKKSFLDGNNQSWEKKGFNFYMNRQYDLAISCYSRVGMDEVCIKIKAIQKQEFVEERLHLLEVKHNIKQWFY